MTRIEWTRRDGHDVEAVVAMFVNREHPNSTRITPSRGDGGADILDRAASLILTNGVSPATGKIASTADCRLGVEGPVGVPASDHKAESKVFRVQEPAIPAPSAYVTSPAKVERGLHSSVGSNPTGSALKKAGQHPVFAFNTVDSPQFAHVRGRAESRSLAMRPRFKRAIVRCAVGRVSTTSENETRPARAGQSRLSSDVDVGGSRREFDPSRSCSSGCPRSSDEELTHREHPAAVHAG
jgi:hypothetical protein